ncbi:hypothetical protein [Lactococcus lactis]|uniref:hypothetical protein n=1 Tax=Lactococcus lactis TaxID=1358 RepID=UPI003D2EC128
MIDEVDQEDVEILQDEMSDIQKLSCVKSKSFKRSTNLIRSWKNDRHKNNPN